jgi:membrane-associated phospholipid phosphatase
MTARRELRYTLDDPWVDGVVTGVAFAWWITSEALQDELMRDSCRWCNPPGLDSSVRNSLRWSNTKAADTGSDLLAYGLLPAATIGVYSINAVFRVPNQNQPAWGDLFLDLLVIGQATAVAADLNQFAKIAAARERPVAYAATPGARHSADDNRSFYSAHTNTSMAIAVSSCTVATMRGYRWAPALCVTLPALSLLAGYLRIASDNHYFSDVAVGALAGAGVGFAVPYLLHRPRVSEPGKASPVVSVRPLVVTTLGTSLLGVSGEF